MAERIVLLICCFLCAIPYFIISFYNKNNEITPISFWSGGENKLKKQIKDIKGYNGEMAEVYKKCALAFFVCGMGGIIYPMIGYVFLACICTIGLFWVYKKYKKILEHYSL